MRISSKILNKFLAISLLTFSFSANSQELNSDKIAAKKGGAVSEELAYVTPINSDFNSIAKQAILVDFNSEAILYDKNSEERMFPSSMTKVLTMYLVFDQIKKGHITMDSELTVSQKAWKTGGSQMFLKVGDNVKISDLIQGVIVQSGNDACVTLAEGLAGSQEAFADDMNVIAKKLGMLNTHFVNPDGLPAQDHYTTAKDLSIIARRLITDFPEYFHYYSQRDYTYGNITQHNRNKLLDIPDLGVDGMKTGYTEMGGYGMIATGVHNGRRYIAVVNGLPTEKDRLKAASELLRYGYSSFRNVKLFNKFDILGKVKIWNGKEDSVAVAPNSDIEFMVNRKNSDLSKYKAQVSYKEPWFAPVKKGDYIANLIVKDQNDKILSQYPLYATKDVAEAGVVHKLVIKIKYLLGRW